MLGAERQSCLSQGYSELKRLSSYLSRVPTVLEAEMSESSVPRVLGAEITESSLVSRVRRAEMTDSSLVPSVREAEMAGTGRTGTLTTFDSSEKPENQRSGNPNCTQVLQFNLCMPFSVLACWFYVRTVF